MWGEKSLYGRKFMGIVRSAFVVDEKGKLAGVFYKVSPKDTVPKAKAVLESLSGNVRIRPPSRWWRDGAVRTCRSTRDPSSLLPALGGVMRRGRVGLSLTAGALCLGSLGVAAASSSSSAGRVHAVVVFLGDSNDVIAATQIDQSLLGRDRGYAAVNIPRPGAVLRQPDSAGNDVKCETYDYWQTRVADMRTRVRPDAYVVDLGINDTGTLGTSTTPGYADYGTKVDWLLASLGNVPVFWTNLPCDIEPASRGPGLCRGRHRAGRGTYPSRQPHRGRLGGRRECAPRLPRAGRHGRRSSLDALGRHGLRGGGHTRPRRQVPRTVTGPATSQDAAAFSAALRADSQLAGERDEQLLGQIGELAQHRAEHADADHRNLHIGVGDDRGAAGLTVEDRHLAEVGAGPTRSSSTPSLVDDRFAFEDHEEGVAGLTFA